VVAIGCRCLHATLTRRKELALVVTSWLKSCAAEALQPVNGISWWQRHDEPTLDVVQVTPWRNLFLRSSPCPYRRTSPHSHAPHHRFTPLYIEGPKWRRLLFFRSRRRTARVVRPRCPGDLPQLTAIRENLVVPWATCGTKELLGSLVRGFPWVAPPAPPNYHCSLLPDRCIFCFENPYPTQQCCRAALCRVQTEDRARNMRCNIH